MLFRVPALLYGLGKLDCWAN